MLFISEKAFPPEDFENAVVIYLLAVHPLLWEVLIGPLERCLVDAFPGKAEAKIVMLVALLVLPAASFRLLLFNIRDIYKFALVCVGSGVTKLICRQDFLIDPVMGWLWRCFTRSMESNGARARDETGAPVFRPIRIEVYMRLTRVLHMVQTLIVGLMPIMY